MIGIIMIRMVLGSIISKDVLTYWLMRTIATSSRSVKRLKASSMACTGVSSAKNIQ